MSCTGVIDVADPPKAIIAVIFAPIVIIFLHRLARGVPKPASSWRFGISAVAALALVALCR